MNESTYKRRVRALMTRAGWHVWCVADRYHAGRPDLIAFRQGQAVALELKWLPSRPTRRALLALVTPTQAHELEALARVDIPGYVLVGSPGRHWLVPGPLVRHMILPCVEREYADPAAALIMIEVAAGIS